MNSESNIQRSGPGGSPDRIVVAARARFRRFGYAKSSMQEIAGACRMSAANLYRFHSNKLAIAAAVVVADQQELLAACDRAVEQAGANTADRLVALFAANIDGIRHRLKQAPLLFELDLKVARENRAIRRLFLDEIESRVVAVLGSGKEGGAVERNSRKARGRLILFASAPFILPWMMLNEPFGDPRAHVEPLVRALVAGLSVDQPQHAATRPSRFS